MKQILIIFIFAISNNLIGQQTLLRVNLKKGDTYLLKVSVKQEMMSEMYTELEIKAITTDIIEKGFVVENQMQKMVVKSLITENKEMYYNSSIKESKMDDFSKKIHQNMKPILEAVPLFVYNKLGKIVDIDLKKGAISTKNFKSNANTLIYPEEPVVIGSSWTKIKTANKFEKNFIYKVIEIDESMVTLEISGKIDGAGTGTIKGNAKIYKNSGIIANMTIVSEISVGEKSLRTITKMTNKKL